MEFEKFPSIGRIKKDVIITEKIDGTNGQISFDDDLNMYVGSRNRWLTPEDDNFGFCKWCLSNEEELRKLGPGRHYGEWWGSGIQRGYNLNERRFSLFNTARWNPGNPNVPECCSVVPIIYIGSLYDKGLDEIMKILIDHGSFASPGFMDPEGVVIYHIGTKTLSKTTFNGDKHKWESV